MHTFKKLSISLLSLLFLTSCGFGNNQNDSSYNDSFFDSSNHDATSINSSNNTSINSLYSSEHESSLSSATSSSLSKETNSTSENSITSSKEDSSSISSNNVTDLGTKSIKEVRDLCKQYVTNLNSSKIGVNELYKVTIKGLAINKFDLIKTKKSYGLDISGPGKVIMGDDSGYIACASSNSSEGTCLYGKVASYAGQETSSYIVTGYLSIYLGQPEIYVPDKSFTWDQSLNVKFDSFKNSYEVSSINEIYNSLKDLTYNCAGHGYSSLYSIKKVKCVQKDYDGSAYTFSDGVNFIKAIPNKPNSLQVGSTYELCGLLTAKDWTPALRIFDAKVINTDINLNIKNAAKPLSITSLKNIKASQEDTDKRFDDYSNSYKDIYYADVYISYYTINGKYYITASDEEYTGTNEITNENSAHTTYKMVAFENHSCWNISWDEACKYCPLADYINESNVVRIYYSLWQLTYASKQPKWKINLFEECLADNDY